MNSAAVENFVDGQNASQCLKNHRETSPKVRQTRAKAVCAQGKYNSFPHKLLPSMLLNLRYSPSNALQTRRTKLLRQLQLLHLSKQVELSCVTCGGAHSHQNCPALDDNVLSGQHISDRIINFMRHPVWEKLSLPDLTPTCMTLELADRSISKPMGIAKDISVKIGVFHFPADFVVVDFEPDPRVPLILGRCFLKTSRALIDVHKGEINSE
ncbi:reverse transcriptase domain-containing protein [Tanacetum coccineum]|uniref:Reverse transcriptase domain-containing protein n=1 Tax=Tanacetum coccineum TaxID=301880 RepID=A0ABQ5A575_9ASTR